MSEQPTNIPESDVPELAVRFRQTLRGRCELPNGALVVAGVSGGMDSIFLLEMLRLCEQPLIVAVFDHHLREESTVEADFVCQYCNEHGIRNVRGSGDVRKYADDNGFSYEEAARNLRYEFLFSTALENHAEGVVVAHHADDQAETVLLHLLRGSGLDGLSGMQPRVFLKQFNKTVPLLRPMLEIWRDEINAWVEKNKLPYVTDYSNYDVVYMRNRIRIQLIPELEESFNPKIKKNLLRLAQTACLDLNVLNDLTDEAWQHCVFHEDDHSVIFSRELFAAQPRGIRHRLVRRAVIALLPQLHDLSLNAVNQGIDFFEKARENETRPWISSLIMACEGENLMIFSEDNRPQIVFYPQLEQDAIPVGLWKPGKVEMPGWSIEVSEVELSDDNRQKLIDEVIRDPFKALVSAETVSLPFVIRKSRCGERFSPLGSNGHTLKVSDFWINIKIPRDYRENYALVADKSGIIWIPGERIADRCAVETHTTRAFQIVMKVEI